MARLALAGVTREYPAKHDHVAASAEELRSHRSRHPAFYGCFDWHSAVHAHWLLARLLRLQPGMAEAGAAREALRANLTIANLEAEAAYFRRPLSRSFERPYGWAWLLKLHEELGRPCDGPDEDRPGWAAAVDPLARLIADRFIDVLPRLTYPVRVGTHASTAFAMSLAHDWAAAAGHDRLRRVIEDRGIVFFGPDADYPAWLEPSGTDFLSPALVEADFMARILAPDGFARWLSRFLPMIARGEPRSLLTPAEVSDRTDPQIVHLDGLNLSRAWSMRSIAVRLGPSVAPDATRVLLDSADRHERASAPHIASGDYAGEHWLATFALLARCGAG